MNLSANVDRFSVYKLTQRYEWIHLPAENDRSLISTSVATAGVKHFFFFFGTRCIDSEKEGKAGNAFSLITYGHFVHFVWNSIWKESSSLSSLFEQHEIWFIPLIVADRVKTLRAYFSHVKKFIIIYLSWEKRTQTRTHTQRHLVSRTSNEYAIFPLKRLDALNLRAAQALSYSQSAIGSSTRVKSMILFGGKNVYLFFRIKFSAHQ